MQGEARVRGCLPGFQLTAAGGSDEPEQQSQAATACALGHRSSHPRGDQFTVAEGVKRLRPISRDVRRSTEVKRDLLYGSDEHLKRDAKFPPMRGFRGRLGLGASHAVPANR